MSIRVCERECVNKKEVCVSLLERVREWGGGAGGAGWGETRASSDHTTTVIILRRAHPNL